MSKPTVVSKDRSFAGVPPNFGFDAHRQRGCHPFCGASRRLWAGLSRAAAGPDFSRQTAVEFAASASQSHREPQPFATHKTG
jgi:hypothetical protein